ncbi:MAG: site-specific DNA-methyltransferase, partial [Acidimicrobiia bacterium]|nr:site-specific DNA-methyltransferase [Acidimicrobiia bacterium]
SSYAEYLTMLEEVFAESVRTLEPGGRIAVNVANLGRRPYRSLSADIIDILQRLGLLLRGEVIWIKARGAAGSTAWGSFQRPTNPVLRDLTERIIVASKGRFDRALTARTRAGQKLPHVGTISRDEFMEATTDLWEMAPESATRVGHPAPFPVELPQRLILLYTYLGDLVLDPFLGSGTTAVAAVRTGRHYAGYDIDERYVEMAKSRIAQQMQQKLVEDEDDMTQVMVPGVPSPADPEEHFQRRAVREGRAAKDLARQLLESVGFQLEPNHRLPHGVEVSFRAFDQKGNQWFFDVSGGFTSSRPGLVRTDILWKAIGKAAVLHQTHPRIPLVLLTANAPPEGSAGHAALRQVWGYAKPIADVIELLSSGGLVRLQKYAKRGYEGLPTTGG